MVGAKQPCKNILPRLARQFKMLRPYDIFTDLTCWWVGYKLACHYLCLVTPTHPTRMP